MTSEEREIQELTIKLTTYNMLKAQVMVELIQFLWSYDPLEKDDWEKIFASGEDEIALYDKEWLFEHLFPGSFQDERHNY